MATRQQGANTLIKGRKQEETVPKPIHDHTRGEVEGGVQGADVEVLAKLISTHDRLAAGKSPCPLEVDDKVVKQGHQGGGLSNKGVHFNGAERAKRGRLKNDKTESGVS